jgi:hypothetical protein
VRWRIKGQSSRSEGCAGKGTLKGFPLSDTVSTVLGFRYTISEISGEYGDLQSRSTFVHTPLVLAKKSGCRTRLILRRVCIMAIRLSITAIPIGTVAGTHVLKVENINITNVKGLRNNYEVGFSVKNNGDADSVRELSVTATGRCSANDRSAAAATRAVIRPSSR